MTDGPLDWKRLTQCGLLLCLFGLLDPEFYLWGTRFHALALRAGLLLVVVGLGMGVVLMAAGRLARGRFALRWLDAVNDMHGGRHRFMDDEFGVSGSLATERFAAVAGPMVNIDGTPMMEGSMVDVMGKVYGDSGIMFRTEVNSC